MKFLEAIANVFRIPDLRKRLLFALALLAIYRLGGHIPTPGIDTAKLEEFFQRSAGRCSDSWICSAGECSGG
jgi:preprotein translocase subunit SecY